MPELFITDDQDAFLEDLRKEIANDVVGQYGRVRKQDALQYLIDNALDGVDLDVDPESVDYDPDAVEEHVDDASTTEATDGGAVTASAGADADGAAGAEAAAADASGADDADAGDAEDDGSSGGPSPTPAGGGDDRLNAMMNLLDEHDDKWQKADTAETKYEVDLPDGDTEVVQTKDDVKAVLFKNY